MAFAWLYPDMQVLLFYIIPIKVKWLGLAAALMWAWDVITYPGIYRLCPILELAGFLVFFGPDVWRTVRDWFINRGRRNDWNNQWRRYLRFEAASFGLMHDLTFTKRIFHIKIRRKPYENDHGYCES